MIFKNKKRIFSISTFLFGAIGLFADVIGLGKIAYDVIIFQNTNNIIFKVLILVLVFIFGAGLGIRSIKGFNNKTLPEIVRFYGWSFVGITCFSYLGIAVTLNMNNYSILTYLSFILILTTEIFAIIGLNIVIEGQRLDLYSLPILLFSLIHLIIIAYSYIFRSANITLYFAGDVLLFMGMTLIGSSMLGDIGFITMIKKIISKISK